MAVIPPIIVEKFTCSGNGLQYEGHARESPADLRAMVTGRFQINDKEKPKSWWLAQTLLYGLPGNKSSTIGQLRERLQAALQQRNGMPVPEKILNMEVEANREFNQLNTRIALKTQPGTSKGKPKPAAKAARTTAVSRTKKGGASAAAPSGSMKARRPKVIHNLPPVKRGRVKREREDEMEVVWFEYEGREGTYVEPGPLRKRARQETTSTLSVQYRSRYHEEYQT